jgi:hypothetical protein
LLSTCQCVDFVSSSSLMKSLVFAFAGAFRGDVRCVSTVLSGRRTKEVPPCSMINHYHTSLTFCVLEVWES